VEAFVMARSLKIYNSKEELSVDAAELFFSEAKKAIIDHGKFTVALSGGSTPVPLFKLLSAAEYRSIIDWKYVHFFWADERCVPKDHSDSNFKLAYDLFLSKLPVPEQNVHRIRGELSAEEAATEYFTNLKKFFDQSEIPEFDLILLGVGSDGHTASIFPGSNSADIVSRNVISVYVKKMDSFRVSLSLQVLNNAAMVVFLVTGKSKALIVREILEDSNSSCPAARVIPAHGKAIWLIDKDAASLLDCLNK
jgi:6-phosphogluconolactonase